MITGNIFKTDLVAPAARHPQTGMRPQPKPREYA
jgi:hypothetical protein